MFEEDEEYEEYEDEMKKALTRFEDMLKTGETDYFDSEELEYIIDEYIQKGNLKKSRRAIDLAIAQHPESNMLKIKEARQLLLENHPKDAFELIQHAERDEEDPDYFLTLGSCLAALGKSEEAIDNYLTALPYFDEDEKFDLYNAIAFEYNNLREFDLAVEFYKKALPFADDVDTIYHEIRCCFLSAQRKDDALAFFQGLVDENPHNSKAWSNIGDIYRMSFQYEESIDPYEFALSIDPEDLWANMHLSDIYYDLGRYQEAVDTLNEALRHGVETSMIRASLGDCYYRLNDIESAAENFQKAIDINPIQGAGWAGMGYIFSDKGDSKKAIKYFKKAYELEPWEIDYLYSIAADYRKLNDFEHAMEYLKKIEELSPSDPDSYFYMADLYGEQDKVDEAIETIQYGLNKTNNAPSLLYLLAYAYFLKGEHQQGLSVLDQALTADFEGYKEFIEYDKELLGNDVDIIDLIAQHKTQHDNPTDPNTENNEN